MKNLILIFLFISNLAKTQNNDVYQYKFEYRLQYQSDSTNHENKGNEDFSLFVVGNKSYFASNNFLVKDSILQSIKLIGDLNFSKVPNTRFRYIITKENNRVNFYDNIMKYKFAYAEQPLFNWKLTGEKAKIDNYNCLQAVGVYAGRVWEAWFTNDIPLSSGPYKFGGLPGLIVRVSDKKMYYVFDLISVKKNVKYDNTLFKDQYYNSFKIISKAEYMKTVKNINENVISELSSSGLTVSPESIERVKANVKRRNNPIELE